MMKANRAGRLMRLAAGAIVLVMPLSVRDAAARGGTHSGSGYGAQGGVSPELALANAYSGIYGLRYTYARETYDFNRCPDLTRQAIVGYFATCPVRFGDGR